MEELREGDERGHMALGQVRDHDRVRLLGGSRKSRFHESWRGSFNAKEFRSDGVEVVWDGIGSVTDEAVLCDLFCTHSQLGRFIQFIT